MTSQAIQSLHGAAARSEARLRPDLHNRALHRAKFMKTEELPSRCSMHTDLCDSIAKLRSDNMLWVRWLYSALP